MESRQLSAATTSDLQAGFGLIETTPLIGTPLAGQLRAKYATGVRDPLFARVLALRSGENEADSLMLVVLDVVKIPNVDIPVMRKAITAKVPIPPDRIWFFSTHTHTGPALTSSFETQRSEEYAAWLPPQVALAAETAWEDAAPASVNILRTPVEGVAFVRRFRMKDGTIRTNPGVGNPDIVEPARTARTVLSLVEFERDATRLPIVLASYPCHADVVGGTEVSADYPGRVCSDLTHRIPSHPETLFLTGPCGDLNHVDVNSSERGTGFEFATEMARKLGDRALEEWENRTQIGGALEVRRTTLTVSRREIANEDLEQAQTLLARESFGGKELSVDGLFARQLVSLNDMPEEMELEIGALIIGDVALVCLPGEMFSELAERIEDESPFRHTFCAELFNNGGAGYLPTRNAYSEGGYEPRPALSSPFAPGTGEQVADAAIALLNQ